MSFAEGILNGKSAIVTGGATGIGSSIVRKLGTLGAKVGIVSRKEENLIAAVRAFKEDDGIDVAWRTGDVRDPDGIKNSFDELAGEIGGIDILVCNAAGNFISPTENLSENAFRTIVDIVLVGTFNFTQAAGEKMKESDGGTILNIVTTYAWTGSGYVIPSASAKAGVLAMTRSLAVEWAKYNICSNAIAPGPFPTEGAWKRLVPPGLNIEKKMKNYKKL